VRSNDAWWSITSRDPLVRGLLLARTATWAPEAAMGRVRASLVLGGAPSAARTGGVTKLTTTLLVGASFVAGYWLGVQRAAEPDASTVNAVSSVTPVTPASAARPVSTVSEVARPLERSTPSPSVSVAATDAAVASNRDAPAARATAPRRATSGARARLARAPAAPSDPAAEELALLARAERAIRTGQPALALSFLDELDARFPGSTMLEERGAARLLADCALSAPGSRRRAELFLSDRAASVYTDRLRRSCGVETRAAIDPTPTPAAADGSSRSGH
jgi:hypothetical protein